ncbi:hypothetical protein Pcinc_002984 [Petrolisthes cinctipes]|uniref:Uncharacterized protein n=1 Tax=Petrolisthes cinctipes TaxID=88211 RepID=A0AAE1L1L0_PETCI|nr:hypothetical protein Pcinc_002984 [Petrolisthes cinctipes]
MAILKGLSVSAAGGRTEPEFVTSGGDGRPTVHLGDFPSTNNTGKLRNVSSGLLSDCSGGGQRCTKNNNTHDDMTNENDRFHAKTKVMKKLLNDKLKNTKGGYKTEDRRGITNVNYRDDIKKSGKADDMKLLKGSRVRKVILSEILRTFDQVSKRKENKYARKNPKQRRKRDTNDDESVEVSEEGNDNKTEELPTPEELAWVDPTQLVRQGAWVQRVPSLANLVGIQLYKYGYPATPPQLTHRRQPSITPNSRPPLNPALNQRLPVNPTLNPRQPLNPALNPRPPINPTLNPRPPLNPALNPRPPLNPTLNPRPPFNPTTNRNNKPPGISNTATPYFGNEFHDKFDKYYKSLQSTNVQDLGRMGIYQQTHARPPMPRQGGPTNSIFNLLNPLNLFGRHQFPQLPRFPVLPPGYRSLQPSSAVDNLAAMETQQKDIHYEVMTDPNAEVYKGYNFREEYPLREDLYVGQDGNIYLRDDYLKSSNPISQDYDPNLDSTNGSPHSPGHTPTDSPSSGRVNDEHVQVQDYDDQDEVYPHIDYNDSVEEDSQVSSYSTYLDNHNLGSNQFPGNQNNNFGGGFRNGPAPFGPRPFGPRPPFNGPPRNPAFGRSPPPPPRPPYAGFLEWLFPSFARSNYPSYFYNPRDIMLPRFRYPVWPRFINSPQQHPGPHEVTQPRQHPPTGPLRPTPTHSPSRPIQPNSPTLRNPNSGSPVRPFFTPNNSPPFRPFNNRPPPANLPPSRPSPDFGRPPTANFSPSRPTLSSPSHPRSPLEPQQFPDHNPYLRQNPNNSPNDKFPDSPNHNIPNSPPRLPPSGDPPLPHHSFNFPPRSRPPSGRARPSGSNNGFYPGNGFFDTDFSTAFHMAHSQKKADVEGETAKSGNVTITTTTTTTTTRPVDQMQSGSSPS